MPGCRSFFRKRRHQECEAVSNSQVGIDYIAIRMTAICVVCISRDSGETPKLGEDP